MTAVASPRKNNNNKNNNKNKAIVFGSVALVLSAVIAAGAGFWWNERNRPSQASKADCALAQQIIDQAQEIPSGRAAVDKWAKETGQLRRSQMKDGYLGARISIYEGWAVLHAKGEGTPPSDKEVLKLSDKANEHCEDALVTLKFPSIAS